MAKNDFDLRLPLIAVVLLTIIEVALIILRILPPVMSYSPGNLFFSLARLVVVAYAGVMSAKEGLRKSAMNGAMLAFAGSSAICVLSFFASSFLGVPVLGLQAGFPSNLLIFAVIIVENTLLGALIAAVAAWVSLKTGKGK